MVKFSICIPAYKDVYFEKCLLSVLEQDFDDYEVIVLNDSSPYNIKRIVSLFDSGKIRYYENAVNVGGERLVDNWNKCLEYASGEFVMMMGDDDMLASNYLSEFDRLIAKYPSLNVYHCRSKIIDEEGTIIRLTTSWPQFESVYNNIWHRISGLRQQFISDFLFRRATLHASGGYYYLPLAWGADDITAYLACQGKGIAHTEKTIFKYRDNGISISSTGNAKLKMKAYESYIEWLNAFLDKEKDAVRNDDDEILYQSLCSMSPRFLRTNKSDLIIKSIRNNLFNIFYWIRNKKRFSLDNKLLIYSFLRSFKLVPRRSG